MNHEPTLYDPGTNPHQKGYESRLDRNGRSRDARLTGTNRDRKELINFTKEMYERRLKRGSSGGVLVWTPTSEGGDGDPVSTGITTKDPERGVEGKRGQ